MSNYFQKPLYFLSRIIPRYALLIVLLFLFRVLEYLFISPHIASFVKPVRSFTYSLEFDFIFVALLCLFSLPIFFLFFLFSRKFFFYSFNIVIVFVAVNYIILTQFFYTSNILLDRTIFFFDWKELMIIVGGETGGVLNDYFWMYLTTFIILFFGIRFYYKKIESNKKVRVIGQVITLTAIALFVFRGSVHPKNLAQYSTHETQVHTSKMTFFYGSILSSFLSKESNDTLDIVTASLKIRQQLSENEIIENLYYPLLRSSDDLKRNDWSKYMKVQDKPNIVFIIAEGLSTQFFAMNSRMGSLTPFLDSLSKKSLFWPNMLSITDRTHGVFAAALAGLPHGFERGFLNYKGETPDYMSLPSILHEKGYSMNFIYGGWARFDGYRDFLEANYFDSIVDEQYIKTQFEIIRDNPDAEFSWGIHDGTMVEAYFKFLETQPSNKPFFNTYLTLSLHTPYDIPNKEDYLAQVIKGIPESSREEFDKHPDLFAAIYYADQSLGKFIKEYSKRDDYKNTVFVIVGDHSVKSIVFNDNLEVYHVPFMVFSPSIHTPSTFHEVVSHWDIAPTLSDLIPQIDVQSDMKKTHWLGNGVSFSDDASAKTPIFLGTFRGDIQGVVLDKHVLLHDRLYTIDKKMQLTPHENELVKQELTQLVNAYSVINKKVMEENKIFFDPNKTPIQ